MIPVLLNHDPRKAPIGMVRCINDELEVTIFKGMSSDQFRAVFGNTGIQVIERDGDLIKKARIVEFSTTF